MATNPSIAPQSDTHRYKAVVRISEAIAACHEPEELASTLADEIGKFLHFDHLYFVVLKENSTEIEFISWGKNPLPWPDLPMKDLPGWDAMVSGEPQHTADWDTEERYPRFKPWAKKMALGSSVRVPLTTPHRRLGVFALHRDTVNPFEEEEISFLELIGRVVAFALDDGLNLRRSLHQNDQLKLLLNVSNQITSNLELRDLLRAIAGNIRELMQCDAVSVSLLEPTGEKTRLFALDFPQGKGLLREEGIHTLSSAGKRALETFRPTIVDRVDPGEVAPQIAAEGFKCRCLIPLVNRGRPSDS